MWRRPEARCEKKVTGSYRPCENLARTQQRTSELLHCTLHSGCVQEVVQGAASVIAALLVD